MKILWTYFLLNFLLMLPFFAVAPSLQFAEVSETKKITRILPEKTARILVFEIVAALFLDALCCSSIFINEQSGVGPSLAFVLSLIFAVVSFWLSKSAGYKPEFTRGIKKSIVLTVSFYILALLWTALWVLIDVQNMKIAFRGSGISEPVYWYYICMIASSWLSLLAVVLIKVFRSRKALKNQSAAGND